MEIHFKGSAKEFVDLIEQIAGRQNKEIELAVDGKELTKSVLEAIHDTSEGKAN